MSIKFLPMDLLKAVTDCYIEKIRDDSVAPGHRGKKSFLEYVKHNENVVLPELRDAIKDYKTDDTSLWEYLMMHHYFGSKISAFL